MNLSFKAHFGSMPHTKVVFLVLYVNIIPEIPLMCSMHEMVCEEKITLFISLT